MASKRFPAPAPRRGEEAKKIDNIAFSKNKKNDNAPSPAQEADAFLQPGIKPVTELLQKDPAKIDTVFLKKGRKNSERSRIIDLCRENGVRFSLVDDAFLSRLWKGRHQGVIARLYETGFVDLPDLLETAARDPLPLVLALDQVQDPGNAGTLARTLYALGGGGLIVPRHNGVYLGAAAARVATGALERLPVAKVANLAQALDAAIDAGFTVYGADATKLGDEIGTERAFSFTPRLPAILVLGGEEGGIRPVIRKRCSAVISIPFARDFDSLNVAQAGGIIISAFAAAQNG
jgi:23S rRNA (guanosine2251-2'-O)-methyltransferase